MKEVSTKQYSNTKSGFIKYIIIIIAALILIAYFRNDIAKIWETPGVKNAILVAISWIEQALSWLGTQLNWLSGQIK